jgi:hypothetical protein
MNPQNNHKENILNSVSEPQVVYGFRNLSEDEKLKIDIHRSDKEKFQLFTQMLRRNSMLNKASILPSQNK